jgi:hypothetical protein
VNVEVVPGVTVTLEVVAPFDQAYVPPVGFPVATIVADCPLQIVKEVLFKLTEGVFVTVTVLVPEFVQPAAV